MTQKGESNGIRLKQYVATFAAGIAAGTAIGWMVRRGRQCNKADAREKVQSSCPSPLDAS